MKLVIIMKKALSIILSVIILLSFLVFAYAENPVSLMIKDEVVYAGDEFTLNLFISDNSKVGGAVIDLNYDSSKLEFISAKEGAIFDSGANVKIRNFDGGKSKVRFTYMSTVSSITSEGILFGVTFKALENANGNTDITISIPNAADFVTSDLEKIPYTVENSTVKIIGIDVDSTDNEINEEDINTDSTTTEPVTLTEEDKEILVFNDRIDKLKILVASIAVGGLFIFMICIVILKMRRK